MEPQNYNNTPFTGIPQSSSSDFTEPKVKANPEPWKIAFIVATVFAIGFAAGFIIFVMKANANDTKAAELQTSLNVTTDQLNRFKEATGVDNPDSVKLATDFSVFYDAILSNPQPHFHNSLILIVGKDSFIKRSKNGEFEIAKFSSNGAELFVNLEPDEDYPIYFYRALPDGTWKMSDFSGGTPEKPITCGEGHPSEAEITALEGIIGC